MLTENESKVLNTLARAWDEFVDLDMIHTDHLDEFRRAIHAAQYIIMCRPTQRKLNSRSFLQ